MEIYLLVFFDSFNSFFSSFFFFILLLSSFALKDRPPEDPFLEKKRKENLRRGRKEMERRKANHFSQKCSAGIFLLRS